MSLQNRIPFAIILALALAQDAAGATEAAPPNTHSHTRVDCDNPFPLSRDCSIWQGPQREIIFAGHHFTIAADDTGRTLLVTRVRELPKSHAGFSFGFSFGSGRRDRHALSRALRTIVRELEDAGLQLQGRTPYRHGPLTRGYYLHFDGDAYRHLKPFTAIRTPLVPTARRQ